MLKEVKRLIDLGFSIIWLRPNSKAPIESNWTKLEDKSFEDLKNLYSKGLNVGVRLGRKIGDGYLTVIDCDVKSTDKKHLDELNQKVREIFKGKAPTVLSGRGNGSRHIYIKTKEPISPFRFSQSSEKVKVLMPSVPPTKNEKLKLTTKELQMGLRLRAAWEISIMGKGQQVVLPPSIHPDSKKPYRWVSPFTGLKSLPLVSIKSKTQEGESEAPIEDFNIEPVDLLFSDLNDDMLDLIIDGKGCEDRSAAMYSATLAMLGIGFTDNQIKTVLTDKENFLGQTAYDHRKTKSRNNAAKWVDKYCLRKAKIELSAEKLFEDVEAVRDLEPLSKEEIKKQSEELEPNWHDKLQRDHKQGKPKSSFVNIRLILENETKGKFITHNEFSSEDRWVTDTPWGSKAGSIVVDSDSVSIINWLAHNYEIEPTVDKVNNVLIQLAKENKYHPVRDFLDSLEWDGKSRLKTWLKDYLRAEGPDRYLEVVGVKTLIGMISRIYQPGCKFDNVLILEGKQGVGKSSAARILAGDEWFSDSTINFNDKDAVMNMQGTWVYELGELSAMSRHDTNVLKEFISRQTDKIRPPYGRRTIPFPRQTIFIGTTNQEEYLKDKTGNRRFWPVKIGRVKFGVLERDRAQLLAEAVERYLLGEDSFVTDKFDLRLIEQEQGNRAEHDDMTDDLLEFFNSEENLLPEDGFKISDLIRMAPCLVGIRNDRLTQIRLSAALRGLGFKKIQKRVVGGRVKLWVKEG